MYCQKSAVNSNHTLNYTFRYILTQLQHLQHSVYTNAVMDLSYFVTQKESHFQNLDLWLLSQAPT